MCRWTVLVGWALVACSSEGTSEDAGTRDSGSRDAAAAHDGARDVGVFDDAATDSSDGAIDGATDGAEPDAGRLLPPSDARPVVVDGEHSFADVARDVAVGEWVQYESTAPERYFENRNGGHDLTWADSAVWDAESQCILHYGGGHLVVPGFSIYCVGTHEWIRGPLPPWLDFEGSVWGYTNHGYDRNAFDPVTRRLFFYRGRALWTFDLATETWTERALTIGNNYLRDFATFVPGAGILAGRGENDSRLFAIDPDDASASLLSDTAFHSALHTFGVYSDVHDVMLYGGGDGQRVVYLRRADGSSVRVADAPDVIRTVASGESGGWALTDPDDGDFLVLFAPTGELHRYDPVADAWSFESRSPFEPRLSRTIAATLPEHGVLLFATRTSDTTARITLHRPH